MIMKRCHTRSLAQHRPSTSCTCKRHDREIRRLCEHSTNSLTRITVMARCKGPEESSSSSSSNGSQSSPASEKYAYSDPVNQFLGNFLPPARDVDAELAYILWDAQKLRGISLENMADELKVKLAANEWFVTGKVDPTLFSDDFAFKDDSVATTGIKSYALGVRKLFDQETSRAELISVKAVPQEKAVKVVWRLEGRVNLPFRPRIAPYVVTTTLGVNADGLINTQLDEFSVPGWQLLAGALLGAWAGPPAAPPVEQLRQEYLKKERGN